MSAESSKKPRGKSFAKGQSGNPGGRPKRTQEEVDLIVACKGKTKDALDTITRLMMSADKDSVKLSAATYLIDRGWGKATQNINASVNAQIDVTSDAATRMAQEFLRSRAAVK